MIFDFFFLRNYFLIYKINFKVRKSKLDDVEDARPLIDSLLNTEDIIKDIKDAIK